jgi:hypothetical protein
MSAGLHVIDEGVDAAGPVLDHHALLPELAELVGHHAQRGVGTAAGGEGGDQGDGLFGIAALRESARRGKKGGGDESPAELGMLPPGFENH